MLLPVATAQLSLVNDTFVERVARHVQGRANPLVHGARLEHSTLTLVGSKRMQNVLNLSARALSDDIPGDFVETGVWHGGVSMILAARLQAEGHPGGRSHWAADSFRGFPPNDAHEPAGQSKVRTPCGYVETDAHK